MRKFLYFLFDVFCVVLALVAALYLRHGVPLIQGGKEGDLEIMLVAMVASSALVLPLMHTHQGIWRFTSAVDLRNVLIAVALVILIGNSSLFLLSRLEMMPRSVPPMHWALAVLLMGGSRLMARQLLRPESLKSRAAGQCHVLLLGAGRTAELYLQFMQQIIQHKVIVEGLVDADRRLARRLFQNYKVLGTPEEIPALLEKFRVHGIHIRQIVLAKLLHELPEHTQLMLKELERMRVVELLHFAQYIGLQTDSANHAAEDVYDYARAFSPSAFIRPKGVYPYIKRVLDVLLSLVLMVVFLPLILVTALLVLFDVGLPVLFWQQRPGRYGRPFRLYKFRTMRDAGRGLNEDRLTHKSADTKRTSRVGKWIRRLRLDELPQLFHIVTGTMSFVGPRPLLPDDQPDNGEIRLSLRPGITGWAQIHGGDALKPEEKLVLDIWYIRNLSLWLDLRILVRTFFVVLKKDRARKRVIAQTKKIINKDVVA